MAENNGGLTATMDEHLSAKGGQNARAALSNGKTKAKRGQNPAADAIDDSAQAETIEPVSADTPAWAARLERKVDQALTHSGAQQQAIEDHEKRLVELESKPSAMGAIEALRGTKEGRKTLRQIMVEAETKDLPMGVRHLAVARRSTIADYAVAGLAVAALGVGGYAGYQWKFGGEG